MPPQYRTPTDLNYAVLTRYLPRLHEILTTAAYAHIYLWSATSRTWSKANFEGSLFVVSLSPPTPTSDDPTPQTQEYQLFLLNRCNLENFSYQLRNPDYIDSDLGNIIMLRANESESAANGTANGNSTSGEDEEKQELVYGLYIFSEPQTSTAGDREKLLRMMKECATTFQATSAAMALPTPVPQQEQQQGRSISLTELFQPQGSTQPPQQHQGYYTQSGWGAPDMGMGRQLPQQQQQQQQQHYYGQPGNAGMGVGLGAGNGGGGDVLMNLFQRASDARLRGGGPTQGY